MGVTPQIIDFSDVPEEGGRRFVKRRQEAGDYPAKILAVEDAPSSKDGKPQYLFTIEAGRGTYPYYCKLQENQLWKLRGLLKAAGLVVPSKRVKVDPTKTVGKSIAVTLEDDEYDGKLQSTVEAVFPLSELNTDGTPDQEEDEEEVEDTAAEVEDEDEDEDEEEPAPPPKKPKKPKKPAPVVDDDELDELEVEDL